MTERSACPVTGCPTLRAPNHLMCRPHWHMVPLRLRALVWATWSRRKRKEGDLVAVSEHRAACVQAIAAVDARLQETTPS